MELRLLGPVDARVDSAPIDLGGARQRTVLAALALRANKPVSTSYLTDAVWDNAPLSASSNLRTYVQRLRRHFRVLTRPAGYLLVAHPGEIDVGTFHELTDRGGTALRQHDFAAAVEHFTQALSLWRGQPLEGLSPGPQLRAEAALLEERRLAAAEQCAQAQMELGDYPGAIRQLRLLLPQHGLRETLWARLMLALHHAGRRAEALETYHEVRRLLIDELGVEPGTELRKAHQLLLESETSDEADARIGAYRQLPMDIAEFVGRQPELRRLHQVARRATGTAVAVVVIQGMAGVGKTRLAVRAAHQIIGSGLFDEIQLYADLMGFADQAPATPAAVLESFLRLLGVSHIPPSLEERAALYRDRLHGKRALLVLDNAADEEQIRPLLPGGPAALVLVTSRRSLPGLDGSSLLPLDVFTTDEALRLLVRIGGPERVTARSPAATRIVETCGHLPIAVSLAARRLRTRAAWSLDDLAARLAAEDQVLSQLAVGDRAVRSTFDLSYRALPAERRRFFRLLGLHPDIDMTGLSAAALVDADPEQAEVWLEALLDEHLVHQTASGRYRLHPLLRAYAVERTEIEDSAGERAEALARLLGWWPHAANAVTEVRKGLSETDRAYVTPFRRSR